METTLFNLPRKDSTKVRVSSLKKPDPIGLYRTIDFSGRMSTRTTSPKQPETKKKKGPKIEPEAETPAIATTVPISITKGEAKRNNSKELMYQGPVDLDVSITEQEYDLECDDSSEEVPIEGQGANENPIVEVNFKESHSVSTMNTSRTEDTQSRAARLAALIHGEFRHHEDNDSNTEEVPAPRRNCCKSR